MPKAFPSENKPLLILRKKYSNCKVSTAIRGKITLEFIIWMDIPTKRSLSQFLLSKPKILSNFTYCWHLHLDWNNHWFHRVWNLPLISKGLFIKYSGFYTQWWCAKPRYWACNVKQRQNHWWTKEKQKLLLEFYEFTGDIEVLRNYRYFRQMEKPYKSHFDDYDPYLVLTPVAF